MPTPLCLPWERWSLGSIALYQRFLCSHQRGNGHNVCVFGDERLGNKTLKFVALFIIICRWLQLIHKDRLAPLENAPFSTLWARKLYRVAQRFHQYLRATNCYKLSDSRKGFIASLS